MKRYPLIIFFIFVFITLTVLTYKANPQFYSYHHDYFEMIHRPPISPATLLKLSESSCESTAQYRHNPQRTGFAENALPRAKVQIIKHSFPFNVGIHGASKASPTVDETGVYIGSDTGWFWKLDHEGNKIWEFYIPGSSNGIHGSAALDDKKVFIGAYNGFIYALDKMNGELLWVNPVGNFIGASPLVTHGAVYISAETKHPDGLVVKLDCNTGETLWTSQWLGGHSHSSPAYHKETDSIIVGANSGRLYSFDNKTGKTNWTEQVKGPIKGTPLILDDKVYFGAWDKKYHSINLKTGKLNWSQFMGGKTQSSLSLVPTHYIGITNTKRGDIVGMDLKTGEFKWRLGHGDTNHLFSVLVTRSKDNPNQFLAWSRCKHYQLCVLDAVTGKLLHNISLPGGFNGAPFAYKDKIYISLIDNHGFVVLQ